VFYIRKGIYMATYLIAYDLKKTKDYASLIAAIKKQYPTYCHVLDSNWIVQTSSDAKSIRDYCQKYMDNDDSIFVSKLTPDAAWGNLSTEITNWIKQQLN